MPMFKIRVTKYRLRHDPEIVMSTWDHGDTIGGMLDKYRDQFLTPGREELRRVNGRRFVIDATGPEQEMYVIELED